MKRGFFKPAQPGRSPQTPHMSSPLGSSGGAVIGPAAAAAGGPRAAGPGPDFTVTLRARAGVFPPSLATLPGLRPSVAKAVAHFIVLKVNGGATAAALSDADQQLAATIARDDYQNLAEMKDELLADGYCPAFIDACCDRVIAWAGGAGWFVEHCRPDLDCPSAVAALMQAMVSAGTMSESAVTLVVPGAATMTGPGIVTVQARQAAPAITVSAALAPAATAAAASVAGSTAAAAPRAPGRADVLAAIRADQAAAVAPRAPSTSVPSNTVRGPKPPPPALSSYVMVAADRHGATAVADKQPIATLALALLSSDQPANAATSVTTSSSVPCTTPDLSAAVAIAAVLKELPPKPPDLPPADAGSDSRLTRDAAVAAAVVPRAPSTSVPSNTERDPKPPSPALSSYMMVAVDPLGAFAVAVKKPTLALLSSDQPDNAATNVTTSSSVPCTTPDLSAAVAVAAVLKKLPPKPPDPIVNMYSTCRSSSLFFARGLSALIY